jgi:hypothetical protein
MTESMVERIARALAKIEYGHVGGDSGDNLVTGTPNWRFCVTRARAVLEALKTPTESMAMAGLWQLQENLGHSSVIIRDADACFVAMIQAALDKGGGR